MRALRGCVLLLVALMAGGAARAQVETAAITQMMQTSAEDWNRGDLDHFMTCYKDSPDILFVGKTITHGYAETLAAYKKAYGTPDAMGKLTFTDLSVQGLDAKFATVTGWFHLKRTAAGGGDAQGYFLLVVEKTAAGWKIVRDDTTGVAMTAAAK